MSNSTTFFIFLNADNDGAYHLKNAPGEAQRPHLIDRGDALMVQADLVQVLHGNLTPNGDPATLIIVAFQFIPTRTSSRFRAAHITIRFSAISSSSSDPEVLNISPKGHFSLSPTKKQVELTHSADISLHGGSSFITAGGGAKWELKESQETQDHTTLSGAIRLEGGRTYGAKNTARWVLAENASQKSGIPTRLQTAVLLKRNYGGRMERFQATVEVKAEAGSIMDTLFGKVPKDDPVIFDPGAKPIVADGLTVEIDAENLGKVDLKALGLVVKTTFLEDGDKSV